MSSWIGVYGQNQSQLDWMKSNYERADKRFRTVHPELDSDGEIIRHGIIVRGNPEDRTLRYRYSWKIPCHWDSGEHFRQTERDIRLVLQELHSPEGLEVYLSPLAD